jgi:hypothetical protein
MKTRVIKERPRNKPRAIYNRNKTVRAKLLRRPTLEGTGVSHQGGNFIEEPHQARPSDVSRGESYNDQLEYMKYRIFETIKDIKP